MSHPPETSLSSRELAERMRDLWMEEEGEGEDINPDAAAALIDAWVRMREANILEECCSFYCHWCKMSKSPAHKGSDGYYHFSGEYEENRCGATAIRELKEKL